MTSNTVKAGTFISILFLVIALFYRQQVDDVLKDRLNSILEGLVKVEKQCSVGVKPKVAVGYGACNDLFIDGKELLKYDEVAKKPEHFDDISSAEELLKTYAYFFRHGAAAERYISNDTLFDTIVDIASRIEGSHFSLGGNAPVMAKRFALEGCEVLLAAKMTPKLQESLPEGVTVAGGDIRKDDIHLILEYKANEEWGIYKSPRANRFIVHNDDNNPLVSSLEEFNKLLKKFNPNLLVVSGLQMMDNYPYPKGVREQRLLKIRDQMVAQAPNTRVHFEMASFVEAELLYQLTQFIIPYADSLGMNEQELANLYNIMLYGNISFVSDSNPRVATVLDQMREIFHLVSRSSLNKEKSHQLTRLHVHTLAYQAILTVKNSPWKNSKAAAAKASLTANRHVCGSKEVDIEKAKLIMDDSFSTSIAAGSRRVPLDVDQPVSCWDEELNAEPGSWFAVEICIAPVLVCTEAYQTAGGGDNISSAGLYLQI
ncbi:ADP-dependent glucokinase [Zootermopsis nevadensis]|uniref:ADP-dependent glucokinase n=1 Tax=Zootermopsis nevadensis TaxID=136037 RepID=A0A067RJ25_ZOONE|nr:ADP-dependent glucokinase [Zootermopsis nevadensis]KDR23023.1 ADP-dependent glucokinase [Zootermopsis nevadensis]